MARYGITAGAAVSILLAGIVAAQPAEPSVSTSDAITPSIMTIEDGDSTTPSVMRQSESTGAHDRATKPADGDLQRVSPSILALDGDLPPVSNEEVAAIGNHHIRDVPMVIRGGESGPAAATLPSSAALPSTQQTADPEGKPRSAARIPGVTNPAATKPEPKAKPVAEPKPQPQTRTDRWADRTTGSRGLPR